MRILPFRFAGTNRLSKKPLQEITSRVDTNDSWVDIFLTIVSDTKTDDSHIYVAKGLYKNNIVGLEIEVSSHIKAGIGNGLERGGSGFASNAVTFKSLGSESDNFVRALAELYEVPTTGGFSSAPLTADIFSLNKRNVNLDKKFYYKLKLFFESNNEELYSEIFLNINTKAKEVELFEKDEEYRSNIIKILTK